MILVELQSSRDALKVIAHSFIMKFAKSFHDAPLADSGFEPESLGYEPSMLPLHQSAKNKPLAGLEPTT